MMDRLTYIVENQNDKKVKALFFRLIANLVLLPLMEKVAACALNEYKKQLRTERYSKNSPNVVKKLDMSTPRKSVEDKKTDDEIIGVVAPPIDQLWEFDSDSSSSYSISSCDASLDESGRIKLYPLHINSPPTCNVPVAYDNTRGRNVKEDL